MRKQKIVELDYFDFGFTADDVLTLGLIRSVKNMESV